MIERRNEKSWFSARSGTDLAQVLGVEHLRELEKKRTIRIPDPVYQYAWTAVQQSEMIRREIAYGFDVVHGAVVKQYENKGDPPSLNKKNGGINIGVETMNTLWTALSGQWYGDPYILHFHTHTRLSKRDLDTAGIHATVLAERYNIDQAAYLAMYNTAVGRFSSSDMSVMHDNDRYFRSMLMGSHQGYRWVINPTNTLIKPPEASSSVSQFAAADLSLMTQCYRRYLRGDSPRIVASDFVREMDQATTAFCRANGYLYFGNTDPLSPQVNRIS